MFLYGTMDIKHEHLTTLLFYYAEKKHNDGGVASHYRYNNNVTLIITMLFSYITSVNRGSPILPFHYRGTPIHPLLPF